MGFFMDRGTSWVIRSLVTLLTLAGEAVTDTDGARRMKGLVLEDKKARQVSMRSGVMLISVSNNRQEHWKEGNWREFLGVLGEGMTRKLVARRWSKLWLVKVELMIKGGRGASILEQDTGESGKGCLLNIKHSVL